MKIFIKAALLIAFFSQLSSHQAQSQSPSLTLWTIMPEPSGDLTLAQIQKLESKITQIVNNSNEAAIGQTNDLVIYPVITIEESGVVEGGMQNLNITTLELSLFVKQLSTNVVFNTFSKKIKGSGSNKSQAISNAFSQIKVADESYKQFIAATKNKVLNYYAEKCGSMIQQAGTLASKNDYEQSLSILQSIPDAAGNCYQEAQKKSLEVYKKYQTLLCAKNITRAKSAIATNNYEEAQGALAQIDPSSSCYPEVKQLIAQISSKVEKRENQEIELEKQRVNAIKEIAKAYYANRVTVVRYNVLVR
ncbi:hypothetical protein [Chitinophaga niabensis]|uniref:Uncharacterized protein n=1 Tax=Chitinophaga niabensis TaxID=536979 RepID=A0A1N6K3Z4_9BACT|nr:hypothetical protein [Chitinophaga niabensis]SIO51036.1 hypothetical protein SAMN04488055_4993 [Chitinophaga niabensis]